MDEERINFYSDVNGILYIDERKVEKEKEYLKPKKQGKYSFILTHTKPIKRTDYKGNLQLHFDKTFILSTPLNPILYEMKTLIVVTGFIRAMSKIAHEIQPLKIIEVERTGRTSDTVWRIEIIGTPDKKILDEIEETMGG